MPTTIQHLLAHIHPRLRSRSETSLLDAQVLLAHCLGKSRTWILAHPEASVDDGAMKRILQGVGRLENGEPLPYVLGHWEFYGLDFKITPAVLIPRPETELLVQTALDWLGKHPDKRQAVDVGTGSGIIGIALAVNIPDLSVQLTDISPDALDIARLNAEHYHLLDRISFHQADLLDGINGSFHMICANLPYIPTEVLKNLPVSQTEPSLALNGGGTGLMLIERLIVQAKNKLAFGGLMLLEIEASQGEGVETLAQGAFPHSSVQILKDLAGLDRVLAIQRKSYMIHLTRRVAWDEAQTQGYVTSPSLEQEGFIHCSMPEQILRVANHFFFGIQGLVLLWIDPEKVTSEIRYERADGEEFPHVYGPIDRAAVISTTDLKPEADGSFRTLNPID